MIREIKYTVDSLSHNIIPKTKQWAGMQYEDNATTITFDLSALGNINALYRIDFNSLGAGYQPSENLEKNSSSEISRDMPLSITQFGGDVQITAVITLLDEDNEETGVCYSYPVTVYFTAVERNEEENIQIVKNLSPIEQSAKNSMEQALISAESARNDAEICLEAKESTENSRFALENGAEFIFSGGNAENTGSVNIVVDAELSEISTNPIENKAVANKFKGYMTKAQVEEALEEAIRSAKQLAISAVYPIGSYYWSSVSTEPSTLFGGIWERVKDRFLLACGDTYSNNETGGESTVTLKVLEMPKHTHEFTIRQNSEAGGVGYVMVGNQYDNPQQVTTTEAGESQPHNNMPPYYAAYCWHRIG